MVAGRRSEERRRSSTLIMARPWPESALRVTVNLCPFKELRCAHYPPVPSLDGGGVEDELDELLEEYRAASFVINGALIRVVQSRLPSNTIAALSAAMSLGDRGGRGGEKDNREFARRVRRPYTVR